MDACTPVVERMMKRLFDSLGENDRRRYAAVIEHRLFPHSTRACRGVIFHTLETVQHYMEKAATTTGLKVKVSILDKVYKTGRKYAGFKKTMKIVFDEILPKWNYRAVPAACEIGKLFPARSYVSSGAI
jgi:hypothetical protein